MTRCPICRQPATERFGLKLFCGFEHAAQWARNAQDKSKAKKAAKDASEQRKRDRERLKHLKTRSEWLREAQTVFNKYIRLRDAGLPCISCGRSTGAKMNAGHYLSVGAHPELRFDEANCHIQCEHCNSYKSGNQAQYRPRLIAKVGQAEVDRLEGPQTALKLTIQEIQQLIAKYKAKVKELTHPTTQR